MVLSFSRPLRTSWLIVGIRSSSFLAKRPGRTRGTCDGFPPSKRARVIRLSPGSQGPSVTPRRRFSCPRSLRRSERPPARGLDDTAHRRGGRQTTRLALGCKAQRPGRDGPAPARACPAKTRNSRRRWVRTRTTVAISSPTSSRSAEFPAAPLAERPGRVLPAGTSSPGRPHIPARSPPSGARERSRRPPRSTRRTARSTRDRPSPRPGCGEARPAVPARNAPQARGQRAASRSAGGAGGRSWPPAP